MNNHTHIQYIHSSHQRNSHSSGVEEGPGAPGSLIGCSFPQHALQELIQRGASPEIGGGGKMHMRVWVCVCVFVCGVAFPQRDLQEIIQSGASPEIGGGGKMHMRVCVCVCVSVCVCVCVCV